MASFFGDYNLICLFICCLFFCLHENYYVKNAKGHPSNDYLGVTSSTWQLWLMEHYRRSHIMTSMPLCCTNIQMPCRTADMSSELEGWSLAVLSLHKTWRRGDGRSIMWSVSQYDIYCLFYATDWEQENEPVLYWPLVQQISQQPFILQQPRLCERCPCPTFNWQKLRLAKTFWWLFHSLLLYKQWMFI